MRSRAWSIRTAVTMALACACFAAAPAHAALVAYWSFDGCTTTDASGNAAHLTTQGGPACVAGRFGEAWQLDGQSQYIDRGADSRFTPGSRPWSVALWEKSTADAPFVVMLEWYRCGANPSCHSGDGANYILALDHGHACWDIRDDAGNDITLIDSTTVIADGSWHFVVRTMNPAIGSIQLYVDGALRKALPLAIGALSSGSVAIPLEVGRHFRTGWGVPDFYFPGALDEVRIYDEELSSSAVAGLFLGNAITGVDAETVSALTIDRSSPNPSRGGRLAVAFTLPSDAPADLALFDIGGRLVERVSGAAHGAGRHALELGATRRLVPGIYLIRLTQVRLVATRRVSVLE